MNEHNQVIISFVVQFLHADKQRSIARDESSIDLEDDGSGRISQELDRVSGRMARS